MRAKVPLESCISTMPSCAAAFWPLSSQPTLAMTLGATKRRRGPSGLEHRSSRLLLVVCASAVSVVEQVSSETIAHSANFCRFLFQASSRGTMI